MSDNKNVRDGRDSAKIDINDPSEVEYIHQQFPQFTHEQIVEVIELKGPSRNAVINFLENKGSGN